MEEVGVVRRCDFGDGVLRYEFDGGALRHHHHLVCSPRIKEPPDFEGMAARTGVEPVYQP